MTKAEKKDYDRKYYTENRERKKAASRAYYAVNREEVIAREKMYSVLNREEILARKRKYYKSNKEEIRVKNDAWELANAKQMKAWHKAYHIKHREKLNAKCKAWYHANKNDPNFAKQKNKYNMDWRRKRRASDPAYRLLCDVRFKVLRILKGRGKHLPTVRLIGCSPRNYLSYLIKPYPGKTFKQLRDEGYEIHHVVPCSSYTENPCPEQLEKIFHYSNTQLIPGTINNQIRCKAFKYDSKDEHFEFSF